MEKSDLTCPACGATVPGVAEGTATRCPACGAVVANDDIPTVGAAEAGPPVVTATLDEDRPAPRRRPAPRSERDDREDRNGRPRARRKKKETAGPSLVWVFVLAAGGLGLAATAVAAVVLVVKYVDTSSDTREPRLVNGPTTQPPNFTRRGGQGDDDDDESGGRVDVPVAPFPPEGYKVVPTAVVPPPAAVAEAKLGPDGRLPGDVSARVQRGTVYIRVTRRDGRKSSGSGFFGGQGIVLTNAHVVGMLGSDKMPAKIEVVLNSGERDEAILPAQVAAVDTASDLAVLRVAMPTAKPVPLPTPLPVYAAERLQLTQPVFVFGFPYGSRLGKNITVSSTTVSSKRVGRDGTLEQVQVKGGMQHGNSGGPVVDGGGNVVGVAVAIIEGTDINFAVPGERVRGLLNGRLRDIEVGDTESRDGRLVVPINVTTLDPFRRVKSVACEWWFAPPGTPLLPGDRRPEMPPGAKRQTVAVNYDATEASGEGAIVLPGLPPLGQVLWVQPVVVNGAGESQWAAAIGREVEPPPQEKGATLRLSLPAGKVPVEFRSSTTTRYTLGDGDSRTRQDEVDARFQETDRTESAGAGARLTVKKFEVSLMVDNHLLEADGGRQRAIEDTPRLALDLHFDAQGNPTRGQSDLSGVPASSQSQVSQFAEHLRQALDLTAVPLPGEVKPGQTWQATRQVPVGTFDKPRSGSAELTYTFRGVRQRDGVEVGVIGVTGTISGFQAQSLSLGGDVRGTVQVALATGQVVKAQLTADVTVDAESTNVGPVSIKMRQELTVLRRQGK